AEFFFLYFFVLLLAAIGGSLQLIAIGAVAVCVAYLYVLSTMGQTWTLWNSPSLIRLPFLFTSAAFYGYLVDRTRRERWRADVVEVARAEAESALETRSEQLRDEADVSAALARLGRDLIASLDAPNLLEHLCEMAARELAADTTETLLWRADKDEFA